MKADFNEAVVIEQLQKKADIQITSHNKHIQELKRERSKGDVGIKSKGKIDFLTRYKGWTHSYVESFN